MGVAMCSFELPPETATGPGLQRLNQAQTALVEMLLESAFAGPARLSLGYWSLLDTCTIQSFKFQWYSTASYTYRKTASSSNEPWHIFRVNNSAMGRREAASVTDTVLEVLPGGVASPVWVKGVKLGRPAEDVRIGGLNHIKSILVESSRKIYYFKFGFIIWYINIYYVILYMHTYISFSYNIMLNTNHDQEFCPSWPWALTGGRKAILCGDFEERQRARALLELLPKATGEKRCAQKMAHGKEDSAAAVWSSTSSNISINFHDSSHLESMGLKNLLVSSFWQPIAPYQMCNRSVIMVTSLPFQSNFRRPWQPWQPWPGFVVRWDPIKWQF